MTLSPLPATAGLLAAATLALGFSGCGGSESATSATSANNPSSASAPSPAASAAAQSTGTIKVVEDEYSLKETPAAAKATNGKVTFDVENKGEIPHEFVVIKTTKQADALLEGKEADEQGNAGEIGNIDPGRTKKLSLKLAPGHYALICNLPGHYMPSGEPGMLADFTVQ